MMDIDEITHEFTTIENRIKEMGDSLWHTK